MRLTDERWTHIVKRHPEMKNQKNRVLEAVENPDYILQGDYGEYQAVKFLIYKEVSKEDGFILTASFTRKPSTKRRIIWKP